MIRQINKKTILLAGAAFALTASLSLGSAMAYFTTYAVSSGTVPLEMGFTKTIPKEEVDTDGKHVTIENIGDYDCFVRVKVFSDVDVTYDGGSDWTKGDGDYWYYNAVLAKGASTPELLVQYTYPVITDPETGELVKNPTKEFNIIVISECTPVIYGDDGSPQADWTHVIKAE